MNKSEKILFEKIKDIPVIDCHEHLGSESDHLKEQIGFFTLFSHYTQWDLLASGMSGPDFNKLRDESVPLEKRWELFEPHWNNIRYGSYARAVLITVKKFYGVSDINKKTCKTIDKKIKAFYKPGIVDKVFDACNIKAALTQSCLIKMDNKRLVPVMPLLPDMNLADISNVPMFFNKSSADNFNSYMDSVKEHITIMKNNGAVGLKMISMPFGEPDERTSREIFPALLKGTAGFDEKMRFLGFVVDEAIKTAAKNDLVLAVHAGYWGDFRRVTPLNMIPIVARRPEARFDIYHLGYPWIRETLNLVKNSPNTWLNFCWANIVSEKAAVQAYDEAIDMIPMNKILAFGGDYMVPEKVYGHLAITRENIAKVLAKRIEDGYFSEKEALKIAKMWFYDNPIQLYKLKV